MGCRYFSRAGLAVLIAGASLATPAFAQRSAPSNFTIMFRSTPIGSEQVTVQRTADGWTVNGSGRVGPPFDLILRLVEAQYDADWNPRGSTVDATSRGQAIMVRTTIEGAAARNAITPLNAETVSRNDAIESGAVLLPNPFAAGYHALAGRLRTAAPGTQLSIYQPTSGSFPAEVGESTTEQIKTVDALITARRTRVVFRPPNTPPISLDVWSEANGPLLRVSIPSQGLEIAREDIASVSTRLVTSSRPNDEDVRIAANGFSLAGTLSKPAAAQGPLPAVILASGADPLDRDETVFGIPILGQLASALADAGFAVLRYDKRGIGQSGGRPESAGLADYTEDLRAAVKMLGDRKDIDRRRLAIVGYGEGGWVGMLAAARGARVAALGLVASAAVSGRDLNLYQVTHAAEQSNRPEAERQAAVALQKRIQDAVISGKGWETIEIADQLRRRAETPYFQSFLTFDPAKVMKDVDHPLLILHADLDRQLPANSADQLETLAKARKKGVVEVAKIPGVNHLLVPAHTGELDEYANLPSRTISPAVTDALSQWLRKTLGP